MGRVLECTVCELPQTALGGVFRACDEQWICGRCWDNIVRTVLAQAGAKEESAGQAVAREMLHKARRLASQA